MEAITIADMEPTENVPSHASRPNPSQSSGSVDTASGAAGVAGNSKSSPSALFCHICRKGNLGCEHAVDLIRNMVTHSLATASRTDKKIVFHGLHQWNASKATPHLLPPVGVDTAVDAERRKWIQIIKANLIQEKRAAKAADPLSAPLPGTTPSIASMDTSLTSSVSDVNTANAAFPDQESRPIHQQNTAAGKETSGDDAKKGAVEIISVSSTLDQKASKHDEATPPAQADVSIDNKDTMPIRKRRRKRGQNYCQVCKSDSYWCMHQSNFDQPFSRARLPSTYQETHEDDMSDGSTEVMRPHKRKRRSPLSRKETDSMSSLDHQKSTGPATEVFPKALLHTETGNGGSFPKALATEVMLALSSEDDLRAFLTSFSKTRLVDCLISICSDNKLVMDFCTSHLMQAKDEAFDDSPLPKGTSSRERHIGMRMDDVDDDDDDLSAQDHDEACQLATCQACYQEFDINAQHVFGECEYHSGDLVRLTYYLGRVHRHPIVEREWTLRHRPENTTWTCCDLPGKESGCRRGLHLSSTDDTPIEEHSMALSTSAELNETMTAPILETNAIDFGKSEALHAPTAACERIAPNEFEKLPDYSPATSNLEGIPQSIIEMQWPDKAPLDLSEDPNRHLLHLAELYIASRLRMRCARYLFLKRRLYLAQHDAAVKGVRFCRKDAKNALKTDYGASTRIVEALVRAGWLVFEEKKRAKSKRSKTTAHGLTTEAPMRSRPAALTSQNSAGVSAEPVATAQIAVMTNVSDDKAQCKPMHFRSPTSVRTTDSPATTKVSKASDSSVASPTAGARYPTDWAKANARDKEMVRLKRQGKMTWEELFQWWCREGPNSVKNAGCLATRYSLLKKRFGLVWIHEEAAAGSKVPSSQARSGQVSPTSSAPTTPSCTFTPINIPSGQTSSGDSPVTAPSEPKDCSSLKAADIPESAIGLVSKDPSHGQVGHSHPRQLVQDTGKAIGSSNATLHHTSATPAMTTALVDMNQRTESMHEQLASAASHGPLPSIANSQSLAVSSSTLPFSNATKALSQSGGQRPVNAERERAGGLPVSVPKGNAAVSAHFKSMIMDMC